MQVLLRRTVFRLTELLHASSYENRPLVQETLAELNAAEEAFETSSVREVVGIVSIDGVRMGDGAPGEAARRLEEALRVLSRP